MRALYFERFRVVPQVRDVAEPECPPHGVVVRVRASGVCRSDWHGWMGHDPDIRLPHVPGHEFAGVISQVGAEVTGWSVGDRVTTPFVNACGQCAQCTAGHHQTCPRQTQPGFTRWGSFAELVVVDHAAVNLVALPDEVDFVTAAGLGCRFATAYRAVVDQGGAGAGQWVAVFGCGGVGLAAVMVARSRGARVIAVDVSRNALLAAADLGAEVVLDVTAEPAADRIRQHTGDGAHLTVDALGRASTLADALASLRPQGRHVQVGLLLGDDADPRVDMGTVVAKELQVYGSHGMAAHGYPRLLAEIADGRLDPARLVARTVSLAEAGRVLAELDRPGGAGITVVVLDDPAPAR